MTTWEPASPETSPVRGREETPRPLAWVEHPFVQVSAIVGVGLILGVYALTAAGSGSERLFLYLLAVIGPAVALVLGNVRRLLLAAILLDIPFQRDFHIGYQREVADLGTLSGYSISLTTLALIILYIIWIAELLTRRAPRPRPVLKVSAPPMTYLAVAALSLLIASSRQLALFELALLAQTFALFLYIVNWTRTKEDVRFILFMLLVGLLLESLLMIGVRVLGHDVSFLGISVELSGTRVEGTFSHPNSAGSYLSLLLAPALALLLSAPHPPHRWLAAAAFAFGTVALVLTKSRGGWVTAVVSVAVLCLVAWRRGWLRPTLPVLLGTAALPFFWLFGDLIVARLFGDDGGSIEGRLPLVQLAWRIIRDHPWLGVGANNFTAALPPYLTVEFNAAWISTVHNKYLLVLAETGIAGLLAYGWFLASTLRRGWQAAQEHDRFLAAIALGLTTAMAGQMLHMMVDIFHHRPQVQLFWIAAALVTAIWLMTASHLKSGVQGHGGQVSAAPAKTGGPR